MENKEYKSSWLVEAEDNFNDAKYELQTCIWVHRDLKEAILGLEQYFELFGGTEGDLHMIANLRATLARIDSGVTECEERFAKARRVLKDVEDNGPRF
jgi:hypothetical protein